MVFFPHMRAIRSLQSQPGIELARPAIRLTPQKCSSFRVQCSAAKAPRQQQAPQKAIAAAVVAALFAFTPAALADLNALEAAAGGEFNVGTAQQYGEADLNGKDFTGQDLRRSNFTSADCRNANFKGANLQGTYFIKAVTAKANFEGANLSDSLMDRAVIVGANLKNANLTRAVFTRSDFKDANIEGADFTNALVDRTQQIALCRYASGVNADTGVDTRKSLGCGSRRRFKEASPSSQEGPQVSDEDKDVFRKSMPVYRR